MAKITNTLGETYKQIPYVWRIQATESVEREIFSTSENPYIIYNI